VIEGLSGSERAAVQDTSSSQPRSHPNRNLDPPKPIICIPKQRGAVQDVPHVLNVERCGGAACWGDDPQEDQPTGGAWRLVVWVLFGVVNDAGAVADASAWSVACGSLNACTHACCLQPRACLCTEANRDCATHSKPLQARQQEMTRLQHLGDILGMNQFEVASVHQDLAEQAFKAQVGFGDLI